LRDLGNADQRSKGDVVEPGALGQARRQSRNVRLRYNMRKFLVIAVLGLTLTGCAICSC
jgi:hypothetical protein